MAKAIRQLLRRFGGLNGTGEKPRDGFGCNAGMLRKILRAPPAYGHVSGQFFDVPNRPWRRLAHSHAGQTTLVRKSCQTEQLAFLAQKRGKGTKLDRFGQFELA